MHAFFFREAWRSFRQHRGLGTTAIFSLTAALTLCGLLLLIAHNARVALVHVGDRREMVVYLNDGVSNEEREALIARLQQLYGTVEYVSKEQAWNEFAGQVGDPALLEAVGENPLPASLRIKLRPELLNFDAMDEAARQVSAFPEVEDVRYGGEWVRRLDQLKAGLERGALIVGITVGLAIVFVMYNTIRLTVLARRPQVQIMTRLGATDRFVATPFVIEAVFEALLAALLALGIVFAFQRAFGVQVTPLVALPWVWSALFLGCTVALASLAATWALARVLRSVGA
jgi:cell division transport system permease protein